MAISLVNSSWELHQHITTGTPAKVGEVAVAYVDKVLTCIQCGCEFVFTAGEQQFFADKEFKHDPKRCKQCRAIHTVKSAKTSKQCQETQTTCAECGQETTVPFKPTQGGPVLCRACFKKSQERSGPRLIIKDRASTRQ